MRSEDDTEHDTDEDAGQTDDEGTDLGEDDQIYVDRDKIDFDPADGLLAGTAVDGTSDIPGSPSNQDGDSDDDDSDDDEDDSEDDR